MSVSDQCGVGISLAAGDDGVIRVKNVQCGSSAHFSGGYTL